jgi:hypothetical protein
LSAIHWPSPMNSVRPYSPGILNLANSQVGGDPVVGRALTFFPPVVELVVLQALGSTECLLAEPRMAPALNMLAPVIGQGLCGCFAGHW